MHSDRCSEHHACAGVYVKQMLCASAYTFAYMLATGCVYALMYVQFVHLALGNEDGGVQLVYEGSLNEGVSIQSKGIKKTFPCLWLPVSLCVAFRVHLLLSACPAFDRIDSRVQAVTFPPGPQVAPMVCTLTSWGLSLVNQRRKEVQAGSVCQLSPPLNRPACEFIHCPCSVCDHTVVAWRKGLFLTEGKVGVLSLSFLFLTRVGVYVCVCVCIRTHTRTLRRWGTRL